MKQYRSNGRCAAIAGAVIVLSLAAIPANAQTRGGSYLQTCTNVRAFGDRIIADCRRMDGSWDRTALHDSGSCVGDIANTNGQLTCARGGRAYGWNPERRWEGYGSSYAPRDYGNSYRGYGNSYYY